MIRRVSQEKWLLSLQYHAMLSFLDDKNKENIRLDTYSKRTAAIDKNLVKEYLKILEQNDTLNGYI